MLKEEGAAKSTPPPRDRFPAKTKRGGGRAQSVGDLLPPSFPAVALEKGHGWYFFRLFCISFLLPPLPPTLFFLRWLDLYSFSSNVSGAYPPCPFGPQSLSPQASPSPKPETPFSPAPAPRARVCPRALSWSASSHVFVREFPSALLTLPQQAAPRVAPSRPPAWVGRGRGLSGASACLSVYPQDDGEPPRPRRHTVTPRQRDGTRPRPAWPPRTWSC